MTHMDEAAQWFLRIRHAEPSTEELEAWNEWLRVEANQKAFDAVARVWQRAGNLTLESEAPRRLRRSWPRTLAAAAVLACVTVGLFIWLNKFFIGSHL